MNMGMKLGAILAIGIVGCLTAVRALPGAETREQVVELMKRVPEKRPSHSQRLSELIQSQSSRAALLPLLEDESADVRFGSAELLGFYPKLTAAETTALVGRFGDNEPNLHGNAVWFAAARTLGSSEPAQLGLLKKGLQSTDAIRRRASIVAIHFSGTQGAVLADDVANLLDDKNVLIRRTALGFMRDVGEQAVPHRERITKCLKDSDFHTQYWAARALGAMGEKGAPSAAALVERLENGVASVRRNAAIALGNIGPKAGPAAAKALTKAFGDFSATVRVAAAEAIGRYGELGRPSTGELRGLLKSNSTEARVAAARSLAVFDEFVSESIAAMVEELEGDQYPWDAAETIGRFKAKAAIAVPQLITALKAPDPETRSAAAAALAEIGDTRARQPLRDAAAEDVEPSVRDSAAKALKELGKLVRDKSGES